jgi:hypothetical protein
MYEGYEQGVQSAVDEKKNSFNFSVLYEQCTVFHKIDRNEF